MIILGNLLNAIALVLQVILTFFTWVIVIQALLSWVNPDPYNPIVRFLYSVTEPLYRSVRRVMPKKSYGPVDFTPLVILLVLMFLNYFLVQVLIDYAQSIRQAGLSSGL